MKVYTKPEIEITELGPLSCIMNSDTTVIDDDGSDPSGIGGGEDSEDPPTNFSSIWDD